MFFDLQNYWIFVVLCAAVYVAISMFLQSNIGGKNSLRSLQLEMRQVQVKLSDAAKKKNDKEMDRLMNENMNITSKLMVVQMQFAVIILAVFFGFGMVFQFVEPGMQDDNRFPMFDDGLAAHCDAVANDGTYSGCYAIPVGANKGAWVIDVSLKSQSNESLSRAGTAIYVEGGSPSDVWVQNVTQGGLLDMALGKPSYHLDVTANQSGSYSRGQSAQVTARVQAPIFSSPISSGAQQTVLDAKNGLFDKKISLENATALEEFLLDGSRTEAEFPSTSGKNYSFSKDIGNGQLFSSSQLRVYETRMALPGAQLEASSDMGTFFHVDLPFTLPLLNIRRIIGSSGVLIFSAFLLSIIYSLSKAIYDSAFKKKS